LTWERTCVRETSFQMLPERDLQKSTSCCMTDCMCCM